MAEEPKLRVGMLGYAFMGKAHSNAYRQMPRFFYPPPAFPEMKVICGIGDAEVERARSQLGWEEGTTVWEDVVNRNDIDVFDNCGPNNLHKDPCIAAAEAGKHVICEKPLALNAKDAEEMAHAVKNAGVKAMVAFNYRRVPAVVLAKKLIDEGYIGKIYHWRAVYLQDWIMDPKFPLVWRLQKELAGSGPHGDLNAHILDLATLLVGKITKVNGMTETFIKERPLESAAGGALGAATAAKATKMGKVTVEDAAIFMARFENGAIGTFEATRFAKGRRNYNRFEINGSKGSLAFNLERFNELEFFSEDDPKFAQGFRTINVTEGVHPYTDHWWPAGHIIGWEHTFIHEIYEFFKAVVEDEPITPNFDDGLYNNKVLDAVLASAAKGMWMSI